LKRPPSFSLDSLSIYGRGEEEEERGNEKKVK